MTPIPEPNATALDWMKKALAAPLLLAKLGSRPSDPPPKTPAEREALAFMKAALGNPQPLIKLYTGTRDAEARAERRDGSALAKRAPASEDGEWTEISEDGRIERTYCDGSLKKIRLLEGGEIPVHGMSAHTLSPNL